MGLGDWKLLIFCLILGVVKYNSNFFTEAQIYRCINGNYTANSTYERNLNSVLSAIPSSIGNSGFYNASSGVGSDRVNTIAICRADRQLGDCRNCIIDATEQLRGFCPWSSQALIWLEFCTLRYSNESIFGIRTQSPGRLHWNNRNVTSVQEFNNDLRQLLDALRALASAGGPMIKAAAGNRTGPDFLTIYAIVQCTPDISADECSGCLESAAQQIPLCCNGRIGLRVLFPSCMLRYETYPFVNSTRIQEVQALLMPAPPPSPSPTPLLPPPSPTGGSRTMIIVIVAVVASVCIFLVGCVCIFAFLRRKQKKKKPEKATASNEDLITESLHYDFDQIKAATNDFSEMNELGHGGFGSVYKGKLNDEKEIAVKRLSRGSAQGYVEFRNEVQLLAELRHRNLVNLLGFASRGTERLLIYEFVKNGSLDHYIFDPIKRSEMNWDRRYKIIVGISKGLLYLHEDSRLRIIHRDLKPSNILLDGEMNPKIADFGLARLFGPDETHGVTSRIVGTYGYMPPEYAYHGQFSIKFDVFSFGVLVLEIISGQKNKSFDHDENQQLMLSFAWRCWCEGTAEKMIDPMVKDDSGSMPDMLRCIHTGLLCVQDSPAKRPTMASVVQMLSSSSISMARPSRPAFVTAQASDSSSASFSKSAEAESEKDPRKEASVNEVTISDMYPR